MSLPRALFFWLAALTITTPAIFGVEKPNPPNVVLIMADDVSWEAFGAYGGEDYDTPNLDRLATEGVRFAHCYSTPICTTSRVMLMTGKHNFRNYTHFGRLDPEEHTIGHLMQEAGYRTAIAGKWQLNGLYDPDKFEDALDPGRPLRAGFDETCLWQVTRHKQVKQGGGERFWSPPLEINGKFVSAEENADQYGPDIMSDFLLDFITRHRDEPFFVYYPSNLVHDPFVPTPDTIGDAPRDQSANTQSKDLAVQKTHFVAMVEYLDKIVGRFVHHLDDLGLLENTIILFTADNGTHPRITSNWQGRKITGGKGGLTDMGTHVPLIAYWKGQTPAGAVIDDLVDFTDVYPTLVDISAQSIPSDNFVDGRSILPLLRGEPAAAKDWMLSHYQPYWGPDPGIFARTTRYKLYGDDRFFDISRDLDEAHNLETNLTPDLRQIRDRLRQVIEQAPPVPEGNKPPERPIHPDWPALDQTD
jgi:arylsulfatase A-like enzyme